MTTMAILMGMHVMIGLETNLYVREGVMADSNARFVERTVRIARELGREIATPAQAREMLGVSFKPSQYAAPTGSNRGRAEAEIAPCAGGLREGVVGS